MAVLSQSRDQCCQTGVLAQAQLFPRKLTHLNEEEKYKTKTMLSSDLYQKKKKKGEREEIREQYIQMGELHLITVVYNHWTKFTSFI